MLTTIAIIATNTHIITATTARRLLLVSPALHYLMIYYISLTCLELSVPPLLNIASLRTRTHLQLYHQGFEHAYHTVGMKMYRLVAYLKNP